MTIAFSILGILLAIAIFVLVKRLRRNSRRRELMAAPLPDSWRVILEKRFPTFNRLPEKQQSQLIGIMHVFLEEKNFEACGGLEGITEEIHVVVAVQACLLLVGIKKHGYFPRLRSILIYPGAYQDRRRRRFDLRHDSADDNSVRLGESWNSGSVVLSWESVLAGAARDDDGQNVVFHEFAHQLDQVNGAADGAPNLPHSGDYKQWAEVFNREYAALVEASNDHRADPLLDTYGATNPAEFFAVSTETFFEMPEDLEETHPELFEQLIVFFGVNPGKWQ